jgi:hypothetical protein
MLHGDRRRNPSPWGLQWGLDVIFHCLRRRVTTKSAPSRLPSGSQLLVVKRGRGGACAQNTDCNGSSRSMPFGTALRLLLAVALLATGPMLGIDHAAAFGEAPQP